MRPILFLLTTALLTASTLAYAEKIYRWTDENGQTHFGSQPPRDLKHAAESVQIKAHRAADAPAVTPATEKPAATPATKELPPSISAEQAATYCKQAREQKQVLSENYNRRFRMPDDTYRPLTDDERAQQNSVADDMIRQYCR